MCSVTPKLSQNQNSTRQSRVVQLHTFLRFLCLARPSRLPLPCNKGFDVWEEPGVEGGVASGESGSFFNCGTKTQENQEKFQTLICAEFHKGAS